jgi:hypothetical protein
MKDPVMQLALLQVKAVRSVITMFNWDHHMIEMGHCPVSFRPLTVKWHFSSRLIVPLQLYFRVILGTVQTSPEQPRDCWPLSSTPLVFTHSIEGGDGLQHLYNRYIPQHVIHREGQNSPPITALNPWWHTSCLGTPWCPGAGSLRRIFSSNVLIRRRIAVTT